MFSQFIHILNIWTILLSTVGIASYSHYCQDELKTISFFVDTTKPCCKKTKTKCAAKVLARTRSCCSNANKTNLSYKSCFSKQEGEKTSLKKKDCCLDKKSYNQSDTETTLEPLNIDISFEYYLIPKSSIVNFVSTYYAFTPQNVRYAALSFFPPPDVPLYILYESFLC
jgi:hypothetical protein